MLHVTTPSLQRTGSVASVHSIASFARSKSQKEAWRGLCRELNSNGVTAEMLKANKEEIFKLCHSTSAPSLGPKISDNDVVPQPGAYQEPTGQHQESLTSIYTTQRMMPVPFVIQVSDLINLVWNVYTAYAGAPEQFRSFSREILSLHVVVRKVEEQLGISGASGAVRQPSSGGVASLSTKDGNNLKIMYDDLRTIMEELHDLLKKYQSLTSNRRNPIDRLGWGQEDLVGLRDKLRSSITLLNTYNGSLAKYVPSPLTYIGVENAKIFLNLCLLGLR